MCKTSRAEFKSVVDMSQGCAQSCVVGWILGPEVVQTLAGYTPVASLCGAGYSDVSMRYIGRFYGDSHGNDEESSAVVLDCSLVRLKVPIACINSTLRSHGIRNNKTFAHLRSRKHEADQTLSTNHRHSTPRFRNRGDFGSAKPIDT